MLGNTTKAVMRVKERIAAHGYESIIFHSNGVGGPAMEDLAERGMFTAVIDYTTDELTDQSFGGFHQAAKRLERVGAVGCRRSSCRAVSTSWCTARAIKCPIDLLDARRIITIPNSH
jgi:uncharacterized protein (UPF0261 family)